MIAEHARQRQEILDAFKASPSQHLTTGELAALALQYNARVHELRQLGHVIPPPVRLSSGLFEYSYGGQQTADEVKREYQSGRRWIGSESGFQMRAI